MTRKKKTVKAWGVLIDGKLGWARIHTTKKEALASADWTETTYKYELVRLNITITGAK